VSEQRRPHAKPATPAFRPALPATSIDETGEQLKAIALPKGIVVVSYDNMEWRADAP
jgi:hypothetical protein